MKCVDWAFVGLLIVHGNPTFAVAARALELNLNSNGLAVIAQEVQRTALQPIRNQAIDDQSFRTSGVRVTVESARFSADFHNVALAARPGSLGVAMRIKDVRVEIDRIKLRNALLRSTCRNTTVKIGHRDGEVLTVDIPLVVKSRRIEAPLNNIRFSIDDKNYEVHGPKSCTGDLGTGHLIKAIVRTVLDNARSRIEEALRKQVARMGSGLTSNLSALANRSFLFKVGQSPLLAIRAIAVTTYPYLISLTTDELTFALGADFSAVSGRDFQLDGAIDLLKGFNLIEGSSAVEVASNKAEAPKPVGTLSVYMQMLTEVMDMVVRAQQELIFLDQRSAPGLEQILNREAAAAIWPDLQRRPLDNELLRAGIKFNTRPELRTMPQQGLVQVDLPDLDLKFFINQGGSEVEYYSFAANVGVSLQPSLKDGQVTLKLAQAPSLELDGQWSEGIAPNPDWVEVDVAQSILSSLFDYLYVDGTAFSFNIPGVRLGNADFNPTSLQVGTDAIRLGLATR